MAATMNVDRIREDFPILRQRVHGKPLVYLDNAATTQKPRAVIDALVAYYETTNANIHRGIHTLAQRATDQYEGTRQKVADFIGAADPGEIVFTRNATEAINLVAQSWGGEHLGPGDEVVLSVMEHHSNIVPWQLLAGRTGAALRFVDVDSEGRLSMDSLRETINPRTKLVAVVHASNVLGTINPVAEITELAHAQGALVLLDGAQSVPHLPVDVQAIGCDFLAFSAHKMYGPTGVGVLWARAELLASMQPFLGGGDMISIVRPEGSTWADVPHKFEAGTPNIADVIAFGAAIDYLQQVGLAEAHAFETDLTAHAIDRLSTIDGISLHGPLDPRSRTGLISFTLPGVHPHDVSEVLDTHGVAIRAGHHCAQPLMRRLGVPATNRASFGIYNTKDEIEVLMEGLHHALEVYGDAGRTTTG